MTAGAPDRADGTGPRTTVRRGPVATARQDPLWRAVALLDVDRRRTALAVLAGAAGLGSAVGLAAVSAWLIARASQMPPVMYLTVAAVTVRTLGISRGVLRYLERLVSHDVALRGMGTLRERLYAGLAAGRVGSLVGIRRGDLLARVGADVDSVGDVVVRGLLPMAVAAVVGLGSVALVGAFLPAAGLALAACLLLAGVAGPWWAVRAGRTAEDRAAEARARMSAEVMTLLDGGAELRVGGRVEGVVGRLRRADTDLAAAADAAARPAAVGAALGPLSVGLAVLAALVVGVPATRAGTLDPVELAVVVLTPLAAFEATTVLPGAAVAVVRSRQAARRILELLDDADHTPAPNVVPEVRASTDGPVPHVAAAPAGPGGVVRLEAGALACGWPGRPAVVTGVDLTLEHGRSVAVVGPSGTGKTTLLLTLAGLLPPAGGEVRLVSQGRDLGPVHRLTRADAAAAATLTAEDAHVFDTTVLENLRVARGDVDADEARDVLDRVGLGPWLAGLPQGLDTLLGPDATRVSGGERRRLLVARSLLSPAPLLLLDEPTEHVDTDAGPLLRGLLDGTLTHGRGVLVVTHRHAGLDAADEVVVLDRTGTVRARGRWEQVRGAVSGGSRSDDDPAGH